MSEVSQVKAVMLAGLEDYTGHKADDPWWNLQMPKALDIMLAALYAAGYSVSGPESERKAVARRRPPAWAEAAAELRAEGFEALAREVERHHRCDLLLPKIAYISQDQWEASGCRCIRANGHEGECACDCWIEKGRVVDPEASAYLARLAEGQQSAGQNTDSEAGQ